MAPIFVAHPKRPFMPMELETANTNGIAEIRKEPSPFAKGQNLIIIRGNLTDPIWRGSPSERPAGMTQARNFNVNHARKSNSAEVKKRYPIAFFDMSHLWGPGFGDEAFAGMMWVSREVNQFLQNQKIERKLREKYDHGFAVSLVGTVESWEEEHQITEFAKSIRYRINVDGPANHHECYDIDIEMRAPGSPQIDSLKATPIVGD